MKVSSNCRSVGTIVAKPRSCFYNIFYRKVVHSRVTKCKSFQRSSQGQQIAKSLLFLPFLAVFLFMVTRTEKMIKPEKVQWELHFVLPFHQISHKKMLKAQFFIWCMIWHVWLSKSWPPKHRLKVVVSFTPVHMKKTNLFKFLCLQSEIEMKAQPSEKNLT